MENLNALKARAYTIWEHYFHLQSKGKYQTAQMKKIVDEQEAYWREELLMLTESEVPDIMESAGLRRFDDDQIMSFHS